MSIKIGSTELYQNTHHKRWNKLNTLITSVALNKLSPKGVSVWTTRPPGGRTFPECCQVIVGSGSDSRLHSINRSPWIESRYPFLHMIFPPIWFIYWTEWSSHSFLLYFFAKPSRRLYQFFDRFHVNQWHFYAYFSESFEFRPTAVLQFSSTDSVGQRSRDASWKRGARRACASITQWLL